MSKYTSAELDKALAMLNKNGNLTPIQYVCDDEKAHLDGIFRHLKALGLVELKETGYIYGVLLLNKGLVFINKGGFENVEQKEKEGNKFQELQRKNLELSNKLMGIDIANKELKEENLKLTNSNLKFENSIKFWKAVSLALGISTSVLALFAIFK